MLDLTNMKKLITSKKFWLVVAVVLLLIFIGSKNRQASPIPSGIETGVVERGDVEEIISETGFVQAMQNIDLAFERGGRVSEIVAKVGMEVNEGDILISLDRALANTEVAGARARLEAEQIRLREMLAGADTGSLALTESSVTAAEKALENAKRSLAEVTTQQNQLVAAAKDNLRSGNLQAYLVDYLGEDPSTTLLPPTISGRYQSELEGLYTIKLYRSGTPSGYSFRISGLESGVGEVSTVNPVPLGTRGLYIQFPANFTGNTTWEILLPNTRSSSYTASLNAYNNAVSGRELAIAQAENAVDMAEKSLEQSRLQLNQTAGPARNERISAQQSLIRQMQASLAASEIAYSNLQLRAPFSGTVTRINTEVGQIINPGAAVVSLISTNNYELNVNISEIDIAEINIGDPAEVVFDAFPDKKYQAKVVQIAPNATLADGVKVFKITLAFVNEDASIRDGLSANIDIISETKTNVIAVPTRSIYEDRDGKFVRTINPAGDTARLPVTTGLRGTNGLTEILEGLEGNETIITFASEEALNSLSSN